MTTQKKSNEYLSINEAIQYTGKSLSTIRRLVIDLKKQKSKYIKESYSSNKKKSIAISIELLNDLFRKNERVNERVNEHSTNTQNNSSEQEFIEHLKNEIAEKNRQINELIKQNDQFQHLLFSFQNKAIETGKEIKKKRYFWQRRN